jgi:DnaJ-class molecular chaperone
VQRDHTIAVHIPAGAPEGFEEVFSGEADESPDFEPGDVIVRVRSKVHSGKGWTRKEGGLVGRITLSVAEVSARARALCCSEQGGWVLGRMYNYNPQIPQLQRA